MTDTGGTAMLGGLAIIANLIGMGILFAHPGTEPFWSAAFGLLTGFALSRSMRNANRPAWEWWATFAIQAGVQLIVAFAIWFALFRWQV